MKKALTMMVVFAALALVAMPVSAQPYSLYAQEGVVGIDGYEPINAAGKNTDAGADWKNWKYQYGGGTWSGVYGGGPTGTGTGGGWIEAGADGDPVIDIEADIEMYYTETFSDNKIYFHLGNIYTADAAAKTAYVNGSFTSNNGMWIGISFEGANKDETNMEKDSGGNYTGRVLNGMVGSRDVMGRSISTESFDVFFALHDGTGWTAPGSYGDGASGTVTDALWWLVNGGAAGTYNVTWKVVIEPDTHQPDGNYNLDPAIVATPVL
jgi:hypothetical protein